MERFLEVCFRHSGDLEKKKLEGELSEPPWPLYKYNKRSHTQLDSRKHNTTFWDRVTTTHKGSLTPTKMSKIDGRRIQ